MKSRRLAVHKGCSIFLDRFPRKDGAFGCRMRIVRNVDSSLVKESLGVPFRKECRHFVVQWALELGLSWLEEHKLA